MFGEFNFGLYRCNITPILQKSRIDLYWFAQSTRALIHYFSLRSASFSLGVGHFRWWISKKIYERIFSFLYIVVYVAWLFLQHYICISNKWIWRPKSQRTHTKHVCVCSQVDFEAHIFSSLSLLTFSWAKYFPRGAISVCQSQFVRLTLSAAKLMRRCLS